MLTLLRILFIVYALPVQAQSENVKVEDLEEVDLLAPTAEEIIMPEQEVQEEISLPLCQDERLSQQVQRLLESYNAEHPVQTLYEKRQRGLQMKNTKVFTEEKVSGFSSKQNRAVADKLLMSKINLALDDKDIRLCKSTIINQHFAPIYLIIYKNKENNIQINVLNFLENGQEELTTIFEP